MGGMSLLERDHYVDNWLDRIAQLEDRLHELERSAKTGAATLLEINITDVSNPPTDAQLDAIFGTPAQVGAGYMAIVNDAGASSNVWLVVSDGLYWWYEALTVCV